MSANDTSVLSDRALRRVQWRRTASFSNITSRHYASNTTSVRKIWGTFSRVTFALEFRLTNLWMR